MDTFLQDTRAALEDLSKYSTIHVFIGNESCDLDSTVCALVYAFYHHKIDQGTETFYLPILNILRSQYHLRTETTFFLGQCNVIPELLTFVDEVNLRTLFNEGKLKLTLVDHHVITKQFSDLKGCVVRIIDHRPLETEISESCSHVIELVGSCSTLVAEELLANESFSFDPVIAKLLYGTILVDTINLSPEAGKSTPKDKDLLQKLEGYIPDVNGQKIYEEIFAAKFDISGLTSMELLEKDLKMISSHSLTIAMSSITMSIQDLLKRPDLENVLAKFSDAKSADVVVVMTLLSPVGGAVERQMAIYSGNRIYRDQVADILQSSHNPALQLESLDSGLEDIVAFNQKNVQASRKKVLPVLKAFLNGETTPVEDLLSKDVSFEKSSFTSQEGFTSLVELSEKGEFQGENDQQQRTSDDNNEKLDNSVLDLFDPFDPLSPQQSETSGSSGAGQISPANVVDEFDLLSLGNQVEDSMATASPAHDQTNMDSNLNNFDPFGFGSPVPNEKIIKDNPPHLTDFIDNLVVNTAKEDDLEFSEADLLQPMSVQDILISGLDSPMEISSGQNSGQGSKVSSYPVTPPNSFMDTNFDSMMNNHDLPSFNSSEMVERIKAKKASLGGGNGDSSSDQDSTDSDKENGACSHGNVAYTPQNSYVEGSSEQFVKETELPSFHSSDMVHRIKEKRASLENTPANLETAEGDTNETFPWTPHNSLVDGSFDKYARENLQSLNSAEIVRKIHEKQASLSSLDENENEAGIQGFLHSETETQENEKPSSVACTLQNSYFESQTGSVDNRTDVEDMIDRLCEEHLKPEENSSDLATDSIFSDLLQNQEMPTLNVGNVVAYQLAERMMEDMKKSKVEINAGHEYPTPASNPGSVAVKQITQQREATLAADMTDSVRTESGNMQLNDLSDLLKIDSNGGGNILVSIATDDRNESAGNDCKSGVAVIKKDLSEEEMSELAMNEVAFALANELIRNALENFSPFSRNSESDTQSPKNPELEEQSGLSVYSELKNSSVEISSDEDQSRTVDEDQTSGQDHEVKGNSNIHAEEKGSDSYAVETEYLPGMDPLHGNMDIVSSASHVLETDAQKEVVESSSFRKISGQESQHVHEEILEHLRLDAEKNKHVEIVDEEMLVDNTGSSELSETVEDNVSSSQTSESFPDCGSALRDGSGALQPSGSGVLQVEATGDVLQEDVGPSSVSEQLQEDGCLPQVGETVEDDTNLLSSGVKAEGNAGSSPVSEMLENSDGHLQAGGLFQSDTSPSGIGEDRAEADGESDAEHLRKVIHVDATLESSIPKQNEGIINPEDSSLNESANSFEDDSPFKRKLIHVGETQDFDSKKKDPLLKGDNSSSPRISSSGMERKEVYMTSAGRISISVDKDAELSSFTMEDVSKASLTSDPIAEEIHMQVGNLITQVDSLIAHADEEFDVFLPGSELRGPSSLTSSSLPQHSQKSEGGSASSQPDRKSPKREESISSIEAKERMKGVELKDEWQDDGFPGMLSEDHGKNANGSDGDGPKIARPKTLGASPDAQAKRKIVPDHSLLDDEEGSDGELVDSIDDVEMPDDLDLADDLDENALGELEWENDTPVRSPDDSEPIPEYTAEEERNDAKNWKTVTLGEKQFRIDLKVIEPYKKVLSHGGYYGDGLNAIIIFSGCYLPDRRRKDYRYVMDNLFFYVVHTLEQLVAEDYMIVYFHGATPRKQMPSFGWLKKCYQMIDRRLRKNLKGLLLVHPTLWLKTVVMMTRPFISSKFSSKLRFVRTLQDLAKVVPMEYIYIPDQVQIYDDRLYSRPNLSTPSTPHSDPSSPR